MKSISETLASTMRFAKFSSPPATASEDSRGLLGTVDAESSSPALHRPHSPSLSEDDDDDLNYEPPPRRSIILFQALGRLFWNTLVFLKPSFLGSSSDSNKTNNKSKPLSRTAYLDGVRGIASLIVVNLHWSRSYYPSIQTAWGANENYSPLLLPILRLIHSGAAMVAIFFVISGFVLAHRSCELMHRREYERIYNGLTSSAFRRAIRLFVPALASSAVTYIIASFGLLKFPQVDQTGAPFHHGLAAYAKYLDQESNLWQWELVSPGFYNPQFWTISIQYKGSLYCYLLLLGLARCGTRARIVFEVLAVVHPTMHMRWHMALFAAGMLLAEIDVLMLRRQEERERVLREATGMGVMEQGGVEEQGDEMEEDTLEKPASSSSLLRSWQRRPWSLGPRLAATATAILSWTVFVVGLYLVGYPRDDAEKSPFYAWAFSTWPYQRYRRRFWIGVGAVLTCGGIMALKPVQRIFTTRFAMYMGKISFSLYLVHAVLVQIAAQPLLEWMHSMTGEQSPWLYAGTFLATTLITYPPIIWAADVFTRAVEVPSTHFASWFEDKCKAKAQ